MSPNKQEPSRLDLFKAGKLPDQRSSNRPHVLQEEVAVTEPVQADFKLRPELVAIGVMVLVLIVLTLAGM